MKIHLCALAALAIVIEPASAEDITSRASALLCPDKSPGCLAAIARNQAVTSMARRQQAEQSDDAAELAEAERRAAQPHNDPGAVPLCPPPHRMTARDGCQ